LIAPVLSIARRGGMSRAAMSASFWKRTHRAKEKWDMKTLIVATAATLAVASPALAKTVKKHPHQTRTLYMQAPVEHTEPAMMNRGMPNTSPDPFINNYLKRSYMGNGQG
jgi:hypothetical protein